MFMIKLILHDKICQLFAQLTAADNNRYECRFSSDGILFTSCVVYVLVFCRFSLPLGVGGWLRFVIVALLGLFY